MTIAQIFKSVTNQRPEPWKEREATDALIEQLSDRVRELMEQNEALRKLARARFGHVQGHYMNKCLHCEAMMDMVDKHCRVCVCCADEAINKAMEAK